MQIKKIGSKTVLYALLIVFLLWTLFPIYWMFVTSLKERSEIYTVPPTLWPQNATVMNYIQAFQDSDFGRFMVNSLFVTLISSVVVVIVAIMGGYALARMNFKGKNAVMLVLLVTQMISMLTILVPLFNMFSKMNLLDNLTALIICYTVANIPFCMITMSSFFRRIPISLEEAASIDGCSRFQAVSRVVIPVMKPGIVATFVFAFTGAWNELFLALMLISTDSRRTIPAGLMGFVQKFDIDWGQMCAAGIVTLIPVAIMFFFVQKHIVSGLTQGAVKE